MGGGIVGIFWVVMFMVKGNLVLVLFLVFGIFLGLMKFFDEWMLVFFKFLNWFGGYFELVVEILWLMLMCFGEGVLGSLELDFLDEIKVMVLVVMKIRGC